ERLERGDGVLDAGDDPAAHRFPVHPAQGDGGVGGRSGERMKAFSSYDDPVKSRRSRVDGAPGVVTLKDVASAAGVSLATASRGLDGGTPGVTDPRRPRGPRA